MYKKGIGHEQNSMHSAIVQLSRERANSTDNTYKGREMYS